MKPLYVSHEGIDGTLYIDDTVRLQTHDGIILDVPRSSVLSCSLVGTERITITYQAGVRRAVIVRILEMPAARALEQISDYLSIISPKD